MKIPIDDDVVSQRDQLLSDLVKASIAIDGDTCDDPFYSGKYIKEKLKLIINGSMEWHPNVNTAYKSQVKDNPHFSRLRK